MDSRNIYNDIAQRTGGDIYIGVVGPGAHRKIHLYQAIYGGFGDSKHRRGICQGASGR